MATLQYIRNKGGIFVTVVIGIALLAFLIPEFLNQAGGGTGRRLNEIAEIKGESITFDEYNSIENTIKGIYDQSVGGAGLTPEQTEQIRTDAWRELINAHVIFQEIEELGLTVTGRELQENLILGDNPHPIIRNLFGGSSNANIDKQNIIGFLNNLRDGALEENQEAQWIFWEKELEKSKLQQKYNNLIIKGLYSTSLEGKQAYQESNTKKDVNYILKRFSDIDDASIEISDDDLKAYFKDHRYEFMLTDESREINYVKFDVVPSASDEETLQKELVELAVEFSQVEDAEQYVNYNSDAGQLYDAKNYSVDEMPENLASLFDAEMNLVIGPYKENNSYKLAKLGKISEISDSVKVSQIMIVPTQERDVMAVRNLGDSLKQLLDDGASFEALVVQFSDDPSGKTEGGSIGWISEESNLPYINRGFIDSTFYGNVGDVKLVGSQVGLHLVKIDAQSKKSKKVQLAVISREVTPSRETISQFYTDAMKFAGENSTSEKFKEAAGSNLRTASEIQIGDRSISGIPSSRKIVQWAYQADKGDVSDVIQLDGDYYIASLNKINPKGYNDLENVEDQVRNKVLKQKKAAQIIAQIKGVQNPVSDMDGLASGIEGQVQTASGLSFNSPIIGGGGFEPDVVSAVVGSKEDANTILEPIAGNSGVYVIQITSAEPEPLDDNYNAPSFNKYQTRVNASFNEALSALNDLADIQDYRWRAF